MSECPLSVGQLIFELKRERKPDKQDNPRLIGWTVEIITDEPDGWYVIASHQFEDEENPSTRTITPQLWCNVYHPNTAAAVMNELYRNRALIDDLYSTIKSEKHYLWAVEGLGILINNNNKQNNPLEIDIF